VKDFSRTLLWRAPERGASSKLEAEFRALSAEAEKEFRAERWEGALHFERSLDLRYRGQGYELNIPVTGRAREDMAARFHDEHQRRYGYHHAGREIELVTIRLRARLRTPLPSATIGTKVLRKGRVGPVEKSAPRRFLPLERAAVVFGGKTVATPIYDRGDLVVGRRLAGPAVITEYSATTVIPPGKKFWVDEAGNLLISMR
jgi:N-methylhydantoinase A